MKPFKEFIKEDYQLPENIKIGTWVKINLSKRSKNITDEFREIYQGKIGKIISINSKAIQVYFNNRLSSMGFYFDEIEPLTKPEINNILDI